MPKRFVQSILLLFLVSIFGIELSFLVNGTLTLSDVWFSLLLVALGVATCFVRPETPAAPVLCFLLGSLSVLFSFVVPDEILMWGGWLGWLGFFFWNACFWLFPFVFIHFSLIFPIPGDWIDRGPSRLLLLYGLYAVLVVFSDPLSRVTGDLVLVSVFILSFFLGLSIFVRQYLYSLTGAEKNRLRVVLIGCLAGGIPWILSLVSPSVPTLMGYLAYFLLPLFPISLVFAVVKENYSVISKGFQNLLIYSLVSAGTLTGFFLFFIAFSSVFSDPEPAGSLRVLLPLVLSAILLFPLRRWAGSYVSAHFYARVFRRRDQQAPTPEFRTIRPNPYIVGNPVRSAEMFFGRERDLSYIRTKLDSEHQGCLTVLSGERRTGKTSILYQILNGRLGEEFIPVFVDMQSMVVDNDRELLQELADRISGALAASGNRGSDNLPGSVTNHVEFSSFMDSAISRIDQHRLVLLVDEYELIESKVREGKLSAELYDYLNSLLERHPRLSFVFTGSRTLAAEPAWDRLIGKSFYREITFLDRKDAEDLVSKPLAGRVLFQEGTVADVIRLTHGHPFYTQLLCQTMVEVLNEGRSNTVDSVIIEKVVDRVIESPPPQLLYSWHGLAGSHKLILSALATLLGASDAYASSERISRMIRSLPESHRQQLDMTRTRVELEGLRGTSILDRDQTKYRFSMDLLRHWIRLEHNVWNVLNELETAQEQS